MADFRQMKSLSQHLRGAEELLKEFGNNVSLLADDSPQAKLMEQITLTEAEIEKKLKMQGQEVCSKEKAIKDLQSELKIMSLQIESHQNSMQLSHDELGHLRKEKTRLKQVPDTDVIAAKTKKWEDEELMFRKHLGVELRKIKGGFLQVAFSQIDHKQPNSLFLFSLKLDENRHYIVSDCKPSISDLNSVVHKLNTDNDFASFIHTMRRRFKELVA